MTYESYKAELACIAEIEASLKGAEDFLMLSATISTYRDKRLLEVREDLQIVRSYRARLATWFWNSRMGNPPSLR